MKVKKHTLLFVVLLMTLSSLATINVPVKVAAQPTPYVKVYVDQPLGCIPGVSVGDTVTVDLIIEVSNITDDSPEGIVGWGIKVQVDPDVLNFTQAIGTPSGYFLWNFADWYFYNYPIQLVDQNATTGLVDVTQQILGGPAGGAGDGTSYPSSSNLLVTLKFLSKSETAYSKIDITTMLYYSANKTWYAPDEVIDGQYNHLLTVESTPIDGIDFTINATTYTTNDSIGLYPGNYTVTMPSQYKVKNKRYNFVEWENTSTNPVRNISLTSNMTITATYVLEGTEYNLTVNSNPITGITFTVDGTTNTTNWSDFLLEGPYTVSMPLTWTVGADEYNFVEWEDSSINPVRTISLTSNMTITASYAKNYTLTVNSIPIVGVNFTIDSTTYTTNASVILLEGSHTVSMPSVWMVGADQYNFTEWEDSSINPVRTISLTSNKIITATYAPVHVLTVESTPIDGINFTINTTTYATNQSVSLLEGNRTVSMPLTWTVGADQYNFVEWEDSSTDSVRVVSLTSNMTIIATYELAVENYTLTVNSIPIVGVNFTIDSTTYATNQSVSLLEGNRTVSMPLTWTVGADQYNFVEWEDSSINPVRTISLTSNITITATYVKLVPPVASFTFSPAEPIVDETVTFNASASLDSDGTIVSYAWDFGDGESDSGATVEHAYTEAGNYTVTLTVTDNDDLTHTITKTITVKEAPPTGIPLELYLIAAGVIGVIIIAIVVYYLKIMRKKPA